MSGRGRAGRDLIRVEDEYRYGQREEEEGIDKTMGRRSFSDLFLKMNGMARWILIPEYCRTRLQIAGGWIEFCFDVPAAQYYGFEFGENVREIPVVVFEATDKGQYLHQV